MDNCPRSAETAPIARPVLSLLDARVLGCLLEKELATPDVYPRSLNGLVNACNQKSNRAPVLDVGARGGDRYRGAAGTALGLGCVGSRCSRNEVPPHLGKRVSGFGYRGPRGARRAVAARSANDCRVARAGGAPRPDSRLGGSRVLALDSGPDRVRCPYAQTCPSAGQERGALGPASQWRTRTSSNVPPFPASTSFTNAAIRANRAGSLANFSTSFSTSSRLGFGCIPIFSHTLSQGYSLKSH